MAGNSGDRRAYQAAREINVLFPEGRSDQTPTTDPYLAGFSHKHVLNQPAQIFMGRVIDYVAMAHSYRVQVDSLQTTIICTDSGTSGMGPVGARQHTIYPPQTSVCVLWNPTVVWGTILCAVPDINLDPRFGLADFVSQGSNVGLQADAMNRYVLSMPLAGGTRDWSAGRPFDAVGNGEWGVFTETGLAFFIDPFMAFMRVDEQTGIWVFYHDQLTRISGHNLQIRTAGAEQEYLNDNHEYVEFSGATPYDWEARGCSQHQLAHIREFTAPQIQQGQNHYSKFEPLYDDQQPFFRYQEFGGYLGQAKSRFLQLPIDGTDRVYRYSVNNATPGVFEEHLSLTGQYVLRSAKGITIAKTTLIPIPKQKLRPEDWTGDTDSNYRHAGIGANGDEHLITDTPTLPAGNPNLTDEGEIRAATVMDLFAYQFNWEGLHPFVYHEKDWYVPQEGDMPNQALAANATPSFVELATTQRLSLASSQLRYVDHRYGSVPYFASEAYLTFLDDGGIAMGDGYGFELRASQGNCHLTVPGDFWIQSGKNTNIWAGRDAIIKAFNSADITASKRDVRIKGESNVMVLGGNDGCGGVLIESRADCPAYSLNNQIGEDAIISGVMIVCRNSPVVACGNHVYLSTNTRKYVADSEMFNTAVNSGNGVEANGDYIGGPIVIDAGRSSLVSYADVHHRHVGSSAVDVLMEQDGAASYYRVNESAYKRTTIGTPLDVNQRVAVNGCIMASGDVQSASKVADATGGYTAKVDDTTVITDTATAINDREGTLVTYATGARQEGRDLVQGVSDIRLAQFSFRTEEQYMTGDFRLYEARWQRLARMTGQNATLPLWVEASSDQIAMTPPLDVTYPFPGNDAWTGDNNTKAFQEIDLELYNPTTGKKVDRSAAYETPELGVAVERVLASSYRIIVST